MPGHGQTRLSLFVAFVSFACIAFSQDTQQLQTAEEEQSTTQGAKNIQTVLEAAREQELRRLLLPELPVLSQTPCMQTAHTSILIYFKGLRSAVLFLDVLPRHFIDDTYAIFALAASSRRPTADSEALKAVKVQGMQIPIICNGPGTLVALSLQPETSTKTAGKHTEIRTPLAVAVTLHCVSSACFGGFSSTASIIREFCHMQ